MSTRTPQTRSQTKKVATSRTSSLVSIPPPTSDIPQKTINITIAITVVVFNVLAFVFWKYHKNIITVPKLNQQIDRLVYTLQLQTFSLIPLVVSLVQVMFTRLLTTARNPLSGNEKHVEKPVRILTNTVEQLILNVFNQLILVTFIPAEHIFIIPFLVFCFTVGRIAFLIGYNIHPKFRTFGFVLTFVPSFLAFGANLIYITGLNGKIAQVVKRVEL